MLIEVRGSAAGGGFQQWNCNSSNCADVRKGFGGLTPRTQSSLAVSAGFATLCCSTTGTQTARVRPHPAT